MATGQEKALGVQIQFHLPLRVIRGSVQIQFHLPLAIRVVRQVIRGFSYGDSAFGNLAWSGL
jgi:hypothetical protein